MKNTIFVFSALAAELYFVHHVRAFVGPGCTLALDPVARMANVWNIPVVTGGDFLRHAQNIITDPDLQTIKQFDLKPWSHKDFSFSLKKKVQETPEYCIYAIFNTCSASIQLCIGYWFYSVTVVVQISHENWRSIFDLKKVGGQTERRTARHRISSTDYVSSGANKI